jgi:hypothetical protein
MGCGAARCWGCSGAFDRPRSEPVSVTGGSKGDSAWHRPGSSQTRSKRPGQCGASAGRARQRPGGGAARAGRGPARRHAPARSVQETAGALPPPTRACRKGKWGAGPGGAAHHASEREGRGVGPAGGRWAARPGGSVGARRSGRCAPWMGSTTREHSRAGWVGSHISTVSSSGHAGRAHSPRLRGQAGKEEATGPNATQKGAIKCQKRLRRGFGAAPPRAPSPLGWARRPSRKRAPGAGRLPPPRAGAR